MNARHLHFVRRAALAGAIVLLALQTGRGATNQILGWNNLGMHCMDSDYSVFSILPPYNTIEAQLIVGGRLVTNGAGYTVTYQAVADPAGSINKSSIGKGNWLQYAPQLFGAVAGDQGLPFPNTNTFWMPGAGNTPQAMIFEQTNEPAGGVFTPVNWFHAYGIPITPYDDAGRKNPYPMMRQIAWSGASPIATNDIVLPVSDEMDCRACHASGSVAAAQPAAGWVWDGIQERDFRLNILRLHDEKNFTSNAVAYPAALAAKGFNPQGLYRGVVADNKPVLCAACHASEALGGGGIAGIPPLTTSIHGFHAHVVDPLSNTTLDSAANRSACYRCHPGSTTRCLRGAMGGAIAADGTMEMQCQSCHGNMSTVGAPSRVGWFMEPNCASCHTGTATSNNGQIRYTSVFTDANYNTVRTPTNWIFSTQTNVPVTGLWLYRFSAGHGGLQCAACHGSTHAEFPSIHANDNVRNVALQGHAGVMVECTACHTSTPTNYIGGPHGMHPVGSAWVSAHPDFADQNGSTQCQACHGTDYRGTVLSRMQADRTLSAFGTKTFFRGAIIGCYTCHNGAGSEAGNTNAAPAVSLVSGNTDNATPLALPVVITSVTNAILRVISQPANGSVGVSSNVLTYFPNPGFIGNDTFTYAAYDGSKNSLLATGTVAVAQGPYSFGIAARVPTNSPAGWPVAFAVVPTVTNYSGPVMFNWTFGDGPAGNTNQFPAHAYNSAGTYGWSVTVTASNATASATGSIVVGAPVALSEAFIQGSEFSFSWPQSAPDVVIEQSDTLGVGAKWTAVTNPPVIGPVNSSLILPVSDGNRFYRVRQPW
jgi:PKD repeat protein